MAKKEGTAIPTSIPHAESSEADVLGICLSEGKTYWEQLARLAGSDPTQLFYKHEHRLIAEAIIKSLDATSDMHETTVEHYLSRHEDDLSVTPRMQIVQLQASTSLTNLASLVKAVNILINKRNLRAILNEIDRTKLKIMEDDDVHPNDVSKELSQLSTSHVVSREVGTMGDLIEEMSQADDPSWVIPTGFTELDKKMNGGLESGRNYVIAARPKIGKTTFMMNMALNALHDGAVVLLVSLETLSRDLVYKMLAADAFVDQNTVKNIWNGRQTVDDLDGEDREAYEESLAFMKEAALYTAFPQDLNDGYHSVVSMVASLRSKYGPDQEIVVFVDYLQLLVQNQYASYEELSQYTRDFKLLAMEMELSIVYLSQLNRDGADGSMPGVINLRGSGTIEQDTDVVIMLNRRSHYDEEAPDHIMDVSIPQSRVGEIGMFELFWQPEQNVVSDLEDSQAWSQYEDEDDDD